MKKIALLVNLIILIITLFSFGKIFVQRTSTLVKEERLSDSQLLEVITDTIPDLLQDSKPVIKVDSVSRYNNWHIVTIKSLRSTENYIPVKVVILDSISKPKLIAGPSTSISELELFKHKVPNSIAEKLQEL